MSPLKGNSLPTGVRPDSGTAPSASGVIGPDKLSSIQRTALERVIVQIQAISNLSAAELWVGLRHEIGVGNEQSLQSGHFEPALFWLEQRLSQQQESHHLRRLQQQLSTRLAIGNNRQAVSQYIRKAYGQTVLSALSVQQLASLVSDLERGAIESPEPKNQSSARMLLPAEHQSLNKNVLKVATGSGESSEQIWSQIHHFTGLRAGDPIASRYYPIISQYLQARKLLLNDKSPTFTSLLQLLKQPATPEELQYLKNSRPHYFPVVEAKRLTLPQSLDILQQIFLKRAADTHPSTAYFPDLPTAHSPVKKSYSYQKPLIGLGVILLMLVLYVFWH